MFEDNILRIAEENDFAPEASIDADFFSNNMDLPEDEGFIDPNDVVKEEKNPFAENWQYEVNKAFMQGFDGQAIKTAFGNDLAQIPNAQEVLDYIDKYEGLMGTVFIDCDVLNKGGMNMNEIPTSYWPFHRFAVNSKNRKRLSTRSFRGSASGEIDAFLNSEDRAVDTVREIDIDTNLPVYQKGCFDGNVVASLFKACGRPDVGDMKEIQGMIKAAIFGSEKAPIETENADLGFGLKESSMDITVAEAEALEDIRMDYNPSDEQDISFADQGPPPVAVELDNGFRF